MSVQVEAEAAAPDVPAPMQVIQLPQGYWMA
jgi:hypothetical protein